jgi:hypothetical protein
MTIEELARNLARRMGQIESDCVTKSQYRNLGPYEQDEPPDGDTYNYLWDAILDVFKAAGVPITNAMLGMREPWSKQ